MNKTKDKNTHNVIIRWCDAFNDSLMRLAFSVNNKYAIKRRMQIDLTEY